MREGRWRLRINYLKGDSVSDCNSDIEALWEKRCREARGRLRIKPLKVDPVGDCKSDMYTL